MAIYRIIIITCLCNIGSIFNFAHAQSVNINVEVFGLNPNQSEANQVLENACDTVGGTNPPTAAAADFLATCNVLNPLDDDDAALAAGLDRLIPEEAFATSDTLTDASDSQLTNINARISSLRSQGGGALGLNYGSIPSGGGAAAPDRHGLEMFLTGQMSDGDVDGGRLQQDAELAASQVTLGADYRLSRKFILGVGIGIFQHQTDFISTAGDSEVEGTNLTAYSTYATERLGYLDVVVDVGKNEFDFSRQINLDGNNQVLAVSNTDSSSVSLTIGIGKNFHIKGWDVGPHVRGSLTRATVDGYSEQADSNQPGFGSALSVGSQSINSTTLSAGVKLARVINTRRAVLVPQLSLEAEIETDSDKDPLTAFFLIDPNQQVFTVDGEERDTSYANFGIGGTATFAHGRNAFAFYETRLAHEFITQHWFKFGVRIEF